QNLSGVPNNLDRHYSSIARADLGSEVAAIRRTENSASKRHNSVYSVPTENDVIARGKQTLKSIAKTDHFPTELVRSEHDRTQHRIKSGTIATTGQYTNARLHFRNAEIREVSSDQPDDQRPPIDHIAASRVAAGLRLLRIYSCYPAPRPSSGADKQF